MSDCKKQNKNRSDSIKNGCFQVLPPETMSEQRVRHPLRQRAAELYNEFCQWPVGTASPDKQRIETGSEKRFTVGVLFSMLRVLLMLAVSGAPSRSATSTDTAWIILEQAAADKSADKRAKAAHALGLLKKDNKAEDMLEKALADVNVSVKVAAAKALGQMGAASARPKLRQALKDVDIEVVIAAANALYLLKDPAAYEVYYAVLTGERKSSYSLVQSELNILKDRKSMEKLAFETGIGFVPFGGMGYEAWKTVTKDDTSPVRAAAAERLAKDPDPKSGRALANSCSDRKWKLRMAAVDAVAERNDPALIDALMPLLDDGNDNVRYDAAAAILHLKAHHATHRSRRALSAVTAPAPSQPAPAPSAAPK